MGGVGASTIFLNGSLPDGHLTSSQHLLLLPKVLAPVSPIYQLISEVQISIG
jgi:hypothetical protein